MAFPRLVQVPRPQKCVKFKLHLPKIQKGPTRAIHPNITKNNHSHPSVVLKTPPDV